MFPKNLPGKVHRFVAWVVCLSACVPTQLLGNCCCASQPLRSGLADSRRCVQQTSVEQTSGNAFCCCCRPSLAANAATRGESAGDCCTSAEGRPSDSPRGCENCASRVLVAESRPLTQVSQPLVLDSYYSNQYRSSVPADVKRGTLEASEGPSFLTVHRRLAWLSVWTI
ncbi:MAG: hypothetical protein KF752_14190 [Pirellulaceae bacterium]|nr:hypothetical protein [Pirellulaceae bacterium]